MKNQDTEKVLKTEMTAFSPTDEEHRNVLKSLRKELLKTGVFLLAGLAALVLGVIAWFVNNSRVQSGPIALSARHEVVKLASKGLRQHAEETFLKLNNGTEYSYGDEKYYFTESGEIALYLSEDYVVSPGAAGMAEFYIIPSHDGSMTAKLYIGLAGYEEKTEEDGTVSHVERITDPALDALLSGHILLFGRYGDRHYSNWLNSGETGGILNNTITVTLPEDTVSGVPYPVNIYWIWPLRYENMVQDLYEESSEEFTERFWPFVEEQAEETNMNDISGTNYQYSRIFLKKKETALDNADSRSRAYNLADEYIGTNADYLYLTIKTAAYEN